MLNGRVLEQHEVVNIACGKQTSLLQICEQLMLIENINLTPDFFSGESRRYKA